MKKAYIDLGHGGTDSGAVGVRNVLEKNIVLEVGKKLEAKLKNCGIEVRMSRTTDTFKTLEYRSSDANKWKADCFVSLHCNSASKKDTNGKTVVDPKPHGLETFCYKFKYRGLADYLQNEMLRVKLSTKDRGVKEGNFHVLRETNMSAALVELGFITNAEDIKLLENKQEEFATAIAKGICKFLGVAYKEASNPTPPPSNSGTLYRICATAVTGQTKADEEVNKLKSLGYKDAYKIAVK